MTVLIVMPVVAVMPASHIAAFFEHRSFSEGVSEGGHPTPQASRLTPFLPVFHPGF